jgi:hypothetical protein
MPVEWAGITTKGTRVFWRSESWLGSARAPRARGNQFVCRARAPRPGSVTADALPLSRAKSGSELRLGGRTKLTGHGAGVDPVRVDGQVGWNDWSWGSFRGAATSCG